MDAEGRWEGPQFTYRSNGSLQGEFTYVAGKPDGKFRRFHPTGALSIEGEHHLGTPVEVWRTYRSAGLSDEAVHECCLPPNTWQVVTHYPGDGRTLDDYFDDQGRQLLRDGSLHPEHPAEVPADARYDYDNQVWHSGQYERAKRQGCFTFWSKAGTMLEVAHYKQGALEGLRERYRQGLCVERRMYRAGELDGPAWEPVPATRFEDTSIAAQEGFYEQGMQVGKWRYLDATGQIVATVEFGPVLDQMPFDDLLAITSETHEPPPLDPAREHLRRLFTSAHSDSNQGALQGIASSIPQLTLAVSEQWLRKLRNEQLEPPQYLAKLLQALLRGMRPEHVFRALCGASMRHPDVGLRLLKVALLLSPDDLEIRAAEALCLTGLGRIREANERVTRLSGDYPREASELRLNLNVTFPEFNYWATPAVDGAHVAAELPTEVTQELESLRAALSKAACRLGLVRLALLEYEAKHGPCEFALPPDLAEWPLEQPATLDVYSFEAEEDTVQVDERLELADYSLPELMLQARTEWTLVCWLHFASGSTGTPPLDRQALPEVLTEPVHFGATLTQAFQDYFRVADQLQTAGIRSRNQHLPDCHWEGQAVSQLSRGLLMQAFAEYRERRAALFFAADASCRSPWQDDLRAM